MRELSNHQNYTIFQYCKIGNILKVREILAQQLLDEDSPIHQVDEYGNSPLYYACLCGHLRLVKYLCEMGAKDDSFGRCYWNALTLEIRKVLKFYNDYNSLNQRNKINKIHSDEENDDEDDLLLFCWKCLKKCLFQSTLQKEDDNNEESNKENDTEMIKLTFEFTDQLKPITYSCHRWLILSRWKNFFSFLFSTQTTTNSTITTMKSQLSNLKPLTTEEISLSKLSNKQMELEADKNTKTPKERIKYFKNLKLKVNEIKEKVKKFNEMKEKNEKLTILENEKILMNCENLENLLQNNLKVPFKKEYFDIILSWFYLGIFTDPNIVIENKLNILDKNKCYLNVIKKFNSSHEKFEYFTTLYSVCQYLGVFDLAKLIEENDFVFSNSYDFNWDSYYQQYQHDLSKCFFVIDNNLVSGDVEINTCQLKLNDLIKKSCNMKITMGNKFQPIEQQQEENNIDMDNNNENNITILCHKSIITGRSMFFKVMIECEFEEGIKFRELENQNQIPVIELQQCNNKNTLIQLISFAYTDLTNISYENAVELIIQAERIGFHKLSLQIEQFLLKQINYENALEMYKVAMYLGSIALLRRAEDGLMDYYIEEIGGGRLTLNDMKEFLENYNCDNNSIVRLCSYVKNKVEKV
ncbi:hypothetical protein ABK040_003488 [Willaertia magna]